MEDANANLQSLRDAGNESLHAANSSLQAGLDQLTAAVEAWGRELRKFRWTVGIGKTVITHLVAARVLSDLLE